MARKRIFEAGALDLLKDIEAGENHGVQLADIAPDANANPAGYYQKEDPEMDGSSEETGRRGEPSRMDCFSEEDGTNNTESEYY